MLRLIIGTAGTGKSVFLREKIKQNARQGKKSILIVPEQFSKTAETDIFSSLEKSQYGLADVFSFTSLLRDVQSDLGKSAQVMLSEAGKAVIAKKSLQNVYKQLSDYANQKNNTSFAFSLAHLFEDFKRNGVDGEKLYFVAENAPKTNAKLKDIALIYSEYCANIADAGSDLEQMYLELSNTLPIKYTDSTEFFVDGFESFTYGQYALLNRIMEKSDDVYIALTCEDVFDRWSNTNPLSYTANTAAKLISNAKKINVKVAPPVKLEKQYRFKTQILQNADNYLMSKQIQQCDNEQNDAFITTFDNQFAEVSFVAAKIIQLTKQGFAFDDIAVVCPQLEKYEHQLQESFSLAEIPYFVDQSRIILSSAPVVLFKNILEIMDKGIKEETVMPLLKTQLTYFDFDTVNCLENYLFVWQDQKLDWQQEFALPYAGMAQEDSEDNREILKNINNLTKQICTVFENDDSETKEKPAKEILSRMYEIVQKLNSEEILMRLIEEMQDKQKADLIVRQWECAVDCVQQLYDICGEMIMRPKELQDLFMLMVQGTEIGFAPQTQDCVMISTPQRMKIDDVRVVFVIGASQDVFPGIISEGTVISDRDIQYLKQNDIHLSADFSQRFAFENLYFYKTLTTSREKLFISCSARNIDSQEILSAEIEGLRDALCLKADNLQLEDYCITEPFFTQYVGETFGIDGESMLNDLNISVPKIGERVFAVHNKEYIENMLGEHMIISPTASENYFKCPFSYLVRNLLKIFPIEKAQVSQREAGEYLHTVAQKVIEKYKEDYGKTDWQQIEQTTNDIVEEYLNQNYPQKVRESVRFESLSKNMHTNALHLLEYIYREQQNSGFRPAAFEKIIGFDSDIKPVTLPLSNGKKVSIIGVCDRIDVMHLDGKDYIRIVDYKTGTKKFSLDDVYNGLSNQLLIYMDGVLKSDCFGENPKPAAVMYQPSDAAFKFDSNDEIYMPVGMAVANEDISIGFDKNGEGEFGVIKGTDKIKSLSGSEVVAPKMFDAIIEHTNDKIKEMAENIYDGNFDNFPMDLGNEKTSCEWCGYRIICREYSRINQRKKADFRIKEENADG